MKIPDVASEADASISTKLIDESTAGIFYTQFMYLYYIMLLTLSLCNQNNLTFAF